MDLRQTIKNLGDIRLLAMDVDGVLTDGGIYIHDDGSESKKFNAFDGHRIKMWLHAGLSAAIISGRNTNATIIRAKQLGIEHVFQGCTEKLTAFEELLSKTALQARQVAYIGDDLVDLPLIKRVGFGVAVADAAPELKASAHYVTCRSGGNGAVGELIEYILRSTGRWEKLIERYISYSF